MGIDAVRANYLIKQGHVFDVAIADFRDTFDRYPADVEILVEYWPELVPQLTIRPAQERYGGVQSRYLYSVPEDGDLLGALEFLTDFIRDKLHGDDGEASLLWLYLDTHGEFGDDPKAPVWRWTEYGKTGDPPHDEQNAVPVLVKTTEHLHHEYGLYVRSQRLHLAEQLLPAFEYLRADRYTPPGGREHDLRDNRTHSMLLDIFNDLREDS